MSWTQASVSRAVKAALRPASEMGLAVSSYTVTFSQGEPTVAVTIDKDSAHASPSKGEANVENLRDRIKGYRKRV